LVWQCYPKPFIRNQIMFGSRNFLFAKTSAKGGSILFMWGQNSSGQLGLGDTTIRSSPVQVGTSNTWTRISTGGAQTLAVNDAGELWSWGENSDGQLGLGDTILRSSPVQVGSLTNWAIPTCGQLYSMCIKTDNTLWTWGRNQAGQLGQNNIIDRSSPVQVGTNWAAVAGGNYNSRTTVAVKTNGELWSWGYGYQGTLGIGIIGNRSSPVQVGALTNWKTPSSNSLFAACTTTDGKLFTWGINNRGQLGLGDTVSRSSPVQVGTLTTWATPGNAGGYFSAMACVKTDGTLWSWGGNAYGTLGQNDTILRSSPVQVGALTNWATPSGGRSTFLCSKTDYTLWGWGGNYAGQLGQNNTIERSSPVQIGTSTTWLTQKSGANTSGAVKEGPKIAPASVSVPVISGTAEDGETLTSTTGTWNNDPYSFTFQWQRGTSNIGGATSSTYAIQVADVGSTLRCVVTATNAIGATPATSANTAVVTVTGKKLYGWGSGSQFSFGVGSVNRSSPVFVGGSGWENLAAARFGGLCTKTDGTLWTWGNGTYGQTGLGNTATRSVPTQIGTLTNWSKPARGGASYRNGGAVACLKTDGTIFTWGYNVLGAIGDGTTLNRSSPVQVGALTTWASISIGWLGTVAVKTSGQLWGWGYGRATGQPSQYSSPMQVGTLTNWSKSQIFKDHSIHVKTDNTLWAMGQNTFGQLGDGTSGYRPNLRSPVQIGSTVWATPIVGGSVLEFSACVRTDGTLWTWGKNNYGQLGIGNTTNYSSPKQVGTLTTWSKVVGGNTIMGAVKTDGTLWAWGQNNYGQLADGTTTNRSSPIQVGALTNWSNPAFGINFAMCTTT
jgi:alpha-tubulin suppressor-like RCC1 family protein